MVQLGGMPERPNGLVSKTMRPHGHESSNLSPAAMIDSLVSPRYTSGMLELPDPLKFQWDLGNRRKNWYKHRVRQHEAEEVFGNEPRIISEAGNRGTEEERYMAWGKADSGRRLAVIYTPRDSKIRVVSAQPMSRKERGLYAKEEV